MIEYLKRRLSEPSTHLAIGFVFYVVAKAFFPQYGLIIDAVAGAFGVTGAAMSEKQVGS